MRKPLILAVGLAASRCSTAVESLGTAAFLPLSTSHLPEFLQKNMFGLLLLSILILYSQMLLRHFSPGDAFIAALSSPLQGVRFAATHREIRPRGCLFAGEALESKCSDSIGVPGPSDISFTGSTEEVLGD